MWEGGDSEQQQQQHDGFKKVFSVFKHEINGLRRRWDIPQTWSVPDPSVVVKTT